MRDESVADTKLRASRKDTYDVVRSKHKACGTADNDIVHTAGIVRTALSIGRKRKREKYE